MEKGLAGSMIDFSRCDVCRMPVRSFSSWDPNDPQAWLLPCLHIICSPCRALRSQGSTNPQTIICPMCRTECLKNTLLLIPDSKSCTVRCETPACPEKKTAAVKCLNCNEKLCNECGMAHRRVTATSNHVLQPVEETLADHCRCPLHNLRAVCYCSCGLIVCPECLLVGLHDGAQHSVSSIAHLAATASLDVDKIKSSTAQELTQIEAGVSSVSVRKQMLIEKIDDLKKEIGNSVVKACNAIVKRGWDMINTLDFVKKNKVDELDRVAGELHCQQLRFNRVNAFVDTVKNFEEPTSVVLTKAYLNNCVEVIKLKKLHSEKNMNILQRPPQVEAKVNFDQIISMASQCGQIYVESSDGSLLPIEIRPAPRTPANVFHFDATGGTIRPQQIINCAPSTSAPMQIRPGLRPRVPIPPGAMNIRPSLTHGQIRVFHQPQQRFRTAHEVAIRQAAQVMHQAPVPDPRLAMFPPGFRPPIITNPHGRYPLQPPPSFVPSAPPIAAFRPERYVMPNGQIVSFGTRHPVSLSSAVPAAALMEQLNGPDGRRLSPLQQYGIGPRNIAPTVLEGSRKEVVSEKTTVVTETHTKADARCAPFVDPKTEQESSQDGCFPNASPCTSSSDKNSVNHFSTRASVVSAEQNDEKNVLISCFSRPNENIDNNNATPENSNSEGVLSSAEIVNSGSGEGELLSEAPSTPATSSNEETALAQRERTDSEPEHLPVCLPTASFEQEEVSPPVTPFDTVQDGSNIESNVSNEKAQEQITPGVLSFEDKNDQLQSDSEDRTQERSGVARVKVPGAGGNSLMEKFFNGSDDVIEKKTSLENEMENAEEETSRHGGEMIWDDYCYVCQQGCDDKTGSLGCCASCPRVFHNCCHIPAIKEKMENLPDEWKCTLCTPAEPLLDNTDTMGTRERLLCSKVLLRCYEDHENVQPFCHPVSRSVSNYHVVIKRPMDFGTIGRRLREKVRDGFTDVSQFILCMNLVFENCSTFNHPDTEVAVAGRKVYQYYVRAVDEYLPCMKSLLWLYITLYSESKIAAAPQKEVLGRSTRSRSTDKDVEELSAKRPRREIRRDSESL